MTQDVEWLFRESGLTVPAHNVDDQSVIRALLEAYGLDGRLCRLDTEKDATYRFTGSGTGNERASDSEFLVKISQPDEATNIVDCQLKVVQWIERHAPDIPVQTVLPSTDGTYLHRLIDNTGRFAGLMRVYNFIPGSVLAADHPTPDRLRAVGALLGRLDHGLKGFSHSGQDRVFVWDLTRFLQFEPLIDLESDPHQQSLARSVFDAYRTWIQPELPTARSQIIHGDFSPFNVVVDPEADRYVSGVIDFGDVMRGPVVFDPAVLLGNHLLTAPDYPWAQARVLLDGYRDVFPLSDVEVGLVAVASTARVTLRALVANWRLRRGTDRAEYVMEHAKHDWGRIENVIAHGFDAAHGYLLHKA